MIRLNIYLVIFITLIAAFIASFCQILYKKGLVNKVSGIKSAIMAFKNKYVAIGFVGYVISLGIYLFALANAPLSVAYPIFASTFIFVALMSNLLLKEKHSNWRYVGVLCIFIGICIVAVST